MELASRWLRLLTFRASDEDYGRLDERALLAGLIACWLVGMGRYWDDPRASASQRTGVGSVVYVFALSAVLWIIVKPVAPQRFEYRRIVTFIAMTSPPAALYAIPVERWMSLESANQVNLWFLGVVACWRVALWMHYLRRRGQLPVWLLLCVAVMPLAGIFIALLALNLHHVVLNIMGGIRDADRSSQDAAYHVLLGLSFVSVPASMLASVGWLVAVFKRATRTAEKSDPRARGSE
jgi:hypothetical protein